jgi:UPF0148 protein
MSSSEQNRQRIVTSADLLRRGATLLREPCPRCSGVQIKYQNKTYCLNEDDISSVLNPEQKVATQPEPKVESGPLHKVLEDKLAVVTKQLESSQDPDEQSKLLELISKYVDTLDKLKRSQS